MKRREFLKFVGSTLLGGGLISTFTPQGNLTGAQGQGVAQEGPLRVGLIEFQTGVAAPVGTAAIRAARIWRDKINAEGGILGRKVEFLIEEEGSASETVDRFKKLTVREGVEAIFGIASTGNGQAVGRLAEDLNQLWLSHDGTTQDGLSETLKDPTYSFRSVHNEIEAVGAAIETVKFFPELFEKNTVRIAGINNDYSYGRNAWAAYQAVLKSLKPEANLKFVKALWPPLGTTDFTSHIASLQAANPDLIMSSFWSGDTTIFLKQAAAAGLFAGEIKGVFTTGGGVHTSLKKSFTPEGLILGYNPFYFKSSPSWPLLKEFVKEYLERYGEFPVYESDHAYFTFQAYKAAIEKGYELWGEWPTKEQVAKLLENISVPSPSGIRGYREDHYMWANFFQGLTTHDNPYDFVTIEPVDVVRPDQAQRPVGVYSEQDFFDWIKSWEFKY